MQENTITRKMIIYESIVISFKPFRELRSHHVNWASKSDKSSQRWMKYVDSFTLGSHGGKTASIKTGKNEIN